MSKSFVGSALGCVLGAAALLASPSSLAQGDGWRPCAEEGQVCQLNGRTLIRYGSPNHWVTRTVAGAVECNNAAFGDPDPGVKKRCEVHAGSWDDPSAGAPRGGPGGTNTGWTFCAAEGELCHFNGQTEIRFGQGGRFNIRTAQNAIQCAVEDFGDPVPGVTKYCEVRSSAARAGDVRRDPWNAAGNNVSGNSAWRYCATEGEVCRVRGRAEVRFGDGRRYANRNVRDEVNCDVSTFGDPARGIRKHCEVRAAAQYDNGGGGASWNGCAREGGTCEFNGQAQVRYGTAGRFVYRDAYNSVRCDNASFGSDPYVGRSKSCEIRR